MKLILLILGLLIAVGGLFVLMKMDKGSGDDLVVTGETHGVGDHSSGQTTPSEAAPNAEAVKEFQTKLDKVFADLPTAEALKGGDAHQTPPTVLRAVEMFAVIANAWDKNDALKPTALDFYKKCFEKKEVVPMVRALCFQRTQELTKAVTGKDFDQAAPKELEAFLRMDQEKK